ncbi:glucose-6-phosphate 1-epimerase, partial [Brachionus plicatilis]
TLKDNMENKISLELDTQNRVEIYFHGATLTSWICDNEEKIFLSSKSVFDNKKAIRGGIPIVFPNFGPWEKGPQHGFARIKKWTIKDSPRKIDDTLRVVLSLKDDEETRALWNHKFELEYQVILGVKSLKTNLIVKNTGSEEFDFTALLHTYFKVDDIGKVSVENFKGLNYIDKVKNGANEIEKREAITIDQETDRIYASTQNTLFINTGNEILTLDKNNLPDTVVWNPWIEKSKQMSDFDDEDFKRMICVEAGKVSSRTILKPDEQVAMTQTLKI